MADNRGVMQNGVKWRQVTSSDVKRRAETQNEPIEFEVSLAVWKTSSNLRTLISSLDIRENSEKISKFEIS